MTSPAATMGNHLPTLLDEDSSSGNFGLTILFMLLITLGVLIWAVVGSYLLVRNVYNDRDRVDDPGGSRTLGYMQRLLREDRERTEDLYGYGTSSRPPGVHRNWREETRRSLEEERLRREG